MGIQNSSKAKFSGQNLAKKSAWWPARCRCRSRRRYARRRAFRVRRRAVRGAVEACVAARRAGTGAGTRGAATRAATHRHRERVCRAASDRAPPHGQLARDGPLVELRRRRHVGLRVRHVDVHVRGDVHAEPRVYGHHPVRARRLHDAAILVRRPGPSARDAPLPSARA